MPPDRGHPTIKLQQVTCLTEFWHPTGGVTPGSGPKASTNACSAVWVLTVPSGLTCFCTASQAAPSLAAGDDVDGVVTASVRHIYCPIAVS